MYKHKTIALIGISSAFSISITRKLMATDNNMLLLARNQEELRKFSSVFRDVKPVGSTTLLDCFREGCWEADIVIMFYPEAGFTDLLNKIEDVVTQKIVLRLLTGKAGSFKEDKIKLPNAKLITGSIGEMRGSSKQVITLKSDFPESIEEISDLFAAAGIEFRSHQNL